MASIKSEREEYLNHVENRVAELQGTFETIMRKSTHDNEMETLARVERAKKSIAAKGNELDTLLEEVRELDDAAWDDGKARLDAAWREYREAVERAELELERADELA